MLNKSKVGGVAPGSLEGARSATGGEPGAAVEVKRWSAGRKKEVVLRLLRAESARSGKGPGSFILNTGRPFECRKYLQQNSTGCAQMTATSAQEVPAGPSGK